MASRVRYGFVKRSRLSKTLDQEPPAEIDMNVSLENFGPISRGKINIRPLTIFIGPNNSGKSYAAMLIHSILAAEHRSLSDRATFNLEYRKIRFFMVKKYGKKLQSVIKNKSNKRNIYVPEPLTTDITKRIIQDIFRNDLEKTISINFGSPVGSLVTSKRRFSKIHIDNSSNFDIVMGKNLSIKYNMTKNMRYKLAEDVILDTSTENKSEKNVVMVRTPRNILERPDVWMHHLINQLIRLTVSRFRQEYVPSDSFYLPAARSGILQAHKAMAASLVQSASLIGTKPFQVPQLSGSISGFISNVIMLDQQHGEFYDLAKQLELELFNGEILVKFQKDNSIPEITYKGTAGEIPLHRASSTISEIAPISLYLKHVLTRGNMLIIEEPEAHLHPANQVIFAKYIVRMIQGGLNVLVTTHSVLMLNEISKYMRLSMTDAKTRTKFTSNDSDYLDFDKVSAHVFTKVNGSSYEIKNMEIDRETGIPEDEFVNVFDKLYNEEIRLQDAMDGQ